MRYTRVDLKNKKNEVFLFIGAIVIIFFLAFFLGTTIFNFFIKDSVSSEKTVNVDIKASSSDSAVENKFVLLQCGVFSVKDNAVKVYNSLCSLGLPVMVEDSGKFKVFYGIYESDAENKDFQTLKSNNIEVSKISLKVNVNDICDKEVVEICRAAIKVLNKLNEKNVDSVNIAELKAWINNLSLLSEKEKNFNIFQDFKQYIVALPDNLPKEKAAELELKIINVVKSMS